MKKYEMVKQFFDSGFWIAEMVKNAVVKGWITEEQYREIAGSSK